MNINDLIDHAHTHALKKGFWDETITHSTGSCATLEAFIGQKIALTHSELSEALEEIRAGNWTETHKPGEKPEGFPSELADTVIRIADLCGYLEIDLESAIIEKLAYNSRSRGHKHGKKF